MAFGDGGGFGEEDGRAVGAAGIVGFFPDVDLAEFAGDVVHGAFGGTEGHDVGEVPEKRCCRVFVTDRADVGFDRLRGDDADDAQRSRGVEELRVSGTANLLVLIAEEEDGPTLARSGRELGAGVDGLEEAFLEEEVDDARCRFEAVARNVDHEDASVEHVGEVRLPGRLRAERVFEFGIGEAGEGGFDRAVDAAAFLVGVPGRDRGFVVDGTFEPAGLEASVAIAVGGAQLPLEQRVAGGLDGRFAEALVEDVLIEPFERVGARDMEEDRECGLRARDRERKPEGRVALALPEQFKRGFQEPSRGVGREAVEQIESELSYADALDRLAGQLCGVCGGRVEVATDVEDEAATIEIKRLDEQMVDDARRLAGAGFAEDGDVPQLRPSEPDPRRSFSFRVSRAAGKLRDLSVLDRLYGRREGH